jgi:hypothetical protein
MVNAMAAVVLMVLAIMLVLALGAIAVVITGISALRAPRRPAARPNGAAVGAGPAPETVGEYVARLGRTSAPGAQHYGFTPLRPR